jgi:hypothetical protein
MPYRILGGLDNYQLVRGEFLFEGFSSAASWDIMPPKFLDTYLWATLSITVSLF